MDLIVPDVAADWVSHLVTWLVALPDVTDPGKFPALRSYASDLTAVGFGILGACAVASMIQYLTGSGRVTDTARRTAIAAAVLASYPVLMHSLLVGTNILTAEMIQHHAVRDGLDKAFGEALATAAITSGLSLGLAIGAAMAVLYFLAALFVLKIGLTAALAVLTITGSLVWGLYPLSRTSWLAQAWVSCLVMVIAIPVAWACIFAAAALLASDTLIFDGSGSYNDGLGPDLAEMVKPFAAVACFWMAYRAPAFLFLVVRASGGFGVVGAGGGSSGSGAVRAGGGPTPSGYSPEAVVRRGVVNTADRFRAIGARAAGALPAVGQRFAQARSSSAAAVRRIRPSSSGSSAPSSAAPSPTTATGSSGSSGTGGSAKPWRTRAKRAAGFAVRANRAWAHGLPAEGRRLRQASARRASGSSRSSGSSSGSSTAPPRGDGAAGSGSARPAARRRPASTSTRSATSVATSSTPGKPPAPSSATPSASTSSPTTVRRAPTGASSAGPTRPQRSAPRAQYRRFGGSRAGATSVPPQAPPPAARPPSGRRPPKP